MKNIFLGCICLFVVAMLNPGQLEAQDKAKNKNLNINFANAILFPSNEAFVAIVSDYDYKDKKIESKNLAHKHSNAKYFFRIGRMIFPFKVYTSFCKQTDVIMYIHSERHHAENGGIDSIPLVAAKRWILVMSSIYDASGNLAPLDEYEKKQFSGIEEFKFINKETFFRVNRPQMDNAILLEWSEHTNFQPPEDIIKGNDTLIEDIQKLSALFCGKKFEFLDGIENVQKVLPSMQTEMGKHIAEAMIKVLEEKVIKAEFPAAPKLDGKNGLNLEAVEKVYKAK